jgi:hypothetical protein
MTGMRWVLLAALSFGIAGTLLAAGNAPGGLEQARAEPNLEKRSGLAMDNAVAAMRQAREAYKAGDMMQVAAKAKEIQESVDLAYTSLMQTGKDPRRSPKWFKRAEIQTRDLLRSMEGLEHDMSFEERAVLENPKEKVQQAHDNLLTGLMEGKKK